ncbi:MAG: TonB-dependent receptor plug domain-containing protein [Pseudomonadales bacterium]|jgi:outer membrane receptor protein involved in Fe transport|nr:TonB-dependent receptor plug domain-containing protein [Pseudomonadales bacterium]
MRNTTIHSSSRTKLCWAIASTLATGLPLLAQAQQPAVEEIQVTGSRIRAVDGMSTPTPVTAITTAELTDIDPGATVAEQLDNLPQFFSTNTAQRGGSFLFTAAGSFLNLRGMGQNRTLVVLNGTRVAPADAQGSVNVDLFPSALMQRIDVVTGGASAAYGADAVAGVVNFVLDREFQGLKANISTGVTERRDGGNYNFSISGGKGFFDDTLHFIGSVEMRHIDQIPNQQKDRWDNNLDWGRVRNPAWVSATATPNVPLRITVPYVFTSLTAPQGMIVDTTPGFAYRNWTFTDDGKGIRPYSYGDYMSNAGSGTQNNQSGGQEYKYWDQATLRGPSGNEVDQRAGFISLKYDVNERLSLTAQTAYGSSDSGRSGTHGNISIAGALYNYTIYRENAYLPPQLASEMDRLGMKSLQVAPSGFIDGPGMINILDNRISYSTQAQAMYTLGFEYKIDDNWIMTGALQRGRATINAGEINVPLLDKYYMAMDSVRDPSTGQIVCNVALRNPSSAELAAFMKDKLLPSPLNILGVSANSPIGPYDLTKCVPFNPFGLGNANQAAKDWIMSDPKKWTERNLTQDFAELLLTGVVHEGWGAGPISLATGLTWRDESFDQHNGPYFGERGVLNAPELGIRGIPQGFASNANWSIHPFSAVGVGSGQRDVWEWFAEINVPLLQFSTGQSLGSTLAYRSANYSYSGKQASWKLGLDAHVIDSLRWRFTKSSDIREPNFAEIFLTGTGGGAVNDPFRGGENNNGLTAPARPNLELKPEIGSTITSGFVWQPKFAEWIDGLSVSIDWYEINLKDAITTYGIQRIVDDSFAPGNAFACGLIIRLPPTDSRPGLISLIENVNINAAMAQARGVDFELGYRMEPDFFSEQKESLSVRLLGGYLGEQSTTTLAGTTIDSVGGSTRPRWQGLVSANYGLGNWNASVSANYFGRTLSNTTWVEGVDVDYNGIASNTIFNSSLSYRGETKNGMTWRTSLNVTNLFDRAPSIFASASHDTLGRRYQVSLSLDF